MCRDLASIVSTVLLLLSASVSAQYLRVYYPDIEQGNSKMVVSLASQALTSLAFTYREYVSQDGFHNRIPVQLGTIMDLRSDVTIAVMTANPEVCGASPVEIILRPVQERGVGLGRRNLGDINT